MKPSYTLIEHTADIGMRVQAPDLPTLFVNAGLAMFDIIAAKKPGKPPVARSSVIELTAENREELFVDWLSELLSIAYAEEVVISFISLQRFDGVSLLATVCGEEFAAYEFKTEIKAVTYHDLQIKQSAEGWEAEVIFDV